MLGREAPAPLPAGRGVAIRGNTTLVSPPIDLPPGAQTLRVAARAPGGGGLVEVRARPQAGGPDLALATLELGARRVSAPVGVSPVAGTTVRIVIDPVPALGTAVELWRVGPVVAPLPAWSVERGALEVAGARGRRAVRVSDAPLRLRSPAFRPPASARFLSLQARGGGIVRASAGGRRSTLRAGAAWRTLRIPLRPRRAGAVALRAEALPGPAGLELRRLGVVLRTPGRSGGSAPR